MIKIDETYHLDADSRRARQIKMSEVDWEAEKQKLSDFVAKYPDFELAKSDYLRPHGAVCISPMPMGVGKYSRALIVMHPDVYDRVKAVLPGSEVTE